ncbi:uncharacterized protein [Rutidosis leptorrhynchoides]|uniref:uncharacterized protein n=1 Tax=Rutidosis leptorrhynchoides TaxID=125765 RepID=UPI003A99C0E5
MVIPENLQNTINDPLYLAMSDHPGMMLTSTPFNGDNFLGWSRTVKMALGAKLKLGFVYGSLEISAVTHEDFQKWTRCDYMVTFWILNSMVAELSESFLYATSASGLWKELSERYGQSNGPLIYQIERDLSKVNQGSLTIAAYYNKLKKYWDELQSLNGVPSCSYGRVRDCTCGTAEKFHENEGRSKLIQFLMQLNDEFKNVRSQILSMDPLPTINKAYYIVQQVEKQKHVTQHEPNPTAFFANQNKGTNYKKAYKDNKEDEKCTFCNMEGHTFDGCFERIGYPDRFKGKKRKKQQKVAAQVTADLDSYLYKDTPFNMENENGINNERVELDQKLVNAVCQEMMKMFKGKGQADMCSTSQTYAGKSYHVAVKVLTDKHVGFYYKKDWIVDTGAFDLMSNNISLFQNIRVLTRPIKVKLPEVGNLLKQKFLIAIFPPSCFIFQDPSIKQVIAAGEGFQKLYICKSSTHFNTQPKYIRFDNGTEIVNKMCMQLFKEKRIIHQRSMVYTPQQNGRVERKHRHLLDTARALELHASLPNEFWGDCILSATYLINKMHVKVLNWKTPYEILHKQAPQYDHLRTIGCLCYANAPKPYQGKFEARGIRCVLLGYPPEQKCYKLYVLDTKEVIYSRDVIFKEDGFPFKHSSMKDTCQQNDLPIPNFAEEDDTQQSTPQELVEPEVNISQSNSQSNTQSTATTKSLRRSSRTRIPPTWLKDFVQPTSAANVAFLKPIVHPLFQEKDITEYPEDNVISLFNVLATTTEPSSYSEAIVH